MQLALAEEMNLRGYAVFNETAATMAFTDPGRARRMDAELIEVARAVQAPPLDVVAVFTIYASARDSAFADIARPDVRIPGRLLNVRTGQLIGSFEVDGLELPPLPVLCDRECLLETVGDNAAILASELADALVLKLDGFEDGEVSAIEEYINAFSCVQSARPVRASGRSAEYWHETRSDDARPNRNLRLTLEHMGVEGQVQFSGNAFVVTKVATR